MKRKRNDEEHDEEEGEKQIIARSIACVDTLTNMPTELCNLISQYDRTLMHFYNAWDLEAVDWNHPLWTFRNSRIVPYRSTSDTFTNVPLLVMDQLPRLHVPASMIWACQTSGQSYQEPKYERFRVRFYNSDTGKSLVRFETEIQHIVAIHLERIVRSGTAIVPNRSRSRHAGRTKTSLLDRLECFALGQVPAAGLGESKRLGQDNALLKIDVLPFVHLCENETSNPHYEMLLRASDDVRMTDAEGKGIPFSQIVCRPSESPKCKTNVKPVDLVLRPGRIWYRPSRGRLEVHVTFELECIALPIVCT